MASKPLCKYGSKCYRRNPDHLRRYSHPSTADEVAEPTHTASTDTGSRNLRRHRETVGGAGRIVSLYCRA